MRMNRFLSLIFLGVIACKPVQSQNSEAKKVTDGRFELGYEFVGNDQKMFEFRLCRVENQKATKCINPFVQKSGLKARFETVPVDQTYLKNQKWWRDVTQGFDDTVAGAASFVAVPVGFVYGAAKGTAVTGVYIFAGNDKRFEPFNSDSFAGRSIASIFLGPLLIGGHAVDESQRLPVAAANMQVTGWATNSNAQLVNAMNTIFDNNKMTNVSDLKSLMPKIATVMNLDLSQSEINSL